MHNVRARTTLLAVTTGLALTLTACGGNDTADTADTADTSDTRSAPAATSSTAAPSTDQGVDGIAADHNDADIAFLDDMHPHHQGALDMAELAATRAASQQVKVLAARIEQAQGPEMARMEAMADAWDVELSAGGHSSHGGSSTDMGMSQDTAMLETLSGAEFDREFLAMMTEHHRAALPMARAEVDNGSNPQAVTLAQEIITAQEAEITEMDQLVIQL